MRRWLTVVLSIIVAAAPLWAASQARAGGGGARIRACSLLTRELLLKVTPSLNTRLLDQFPPEEEEVGVNGTYCEYGNVGLQVNPFARAQEMRKSMEKEWMPVSGVGDTAFFRNNKNMYAELIVWTGANHFTIQMNVPMGTTAESLRPNTIALANAIIPKLR
jgi:hypothetical protein